MLSLTFDDPTGAAVHLLNVAASVSNFKPVLQEIANDFYAEEKRVFGSRGGYGGRSEWEDLGPLYNKWKIANYPARPILECTGALRRSLTIPGAAGSDLKIKAMSLYVGSKVGTGKGGKKHKRAKNYNVAWLHDEGVESMKGVFQGVRMDGKRMPARRVMEITDMQKQRWGDMLARYVASGGGKG